MLRCGDEHGRRAVDAGRDRAPRDAGRRSTRPTRAARYEFGDADAAVLLARRAAAARAREPATPGRARRTVVVVRSAQQRIALHVDEVLGNQEVVVKNLGPQLSRLPGLAGMTLLASGAVALIYNPVALADAVRRRGPRARRWRRAPRGAGAAAAARPSAAVAGGAAGAGGRRLADGAPRHAAPAGARGLPRRRSPRTASTRSSGWPRSCRRWCCPTSRCRAWTASTWCATSAPMRAGATCR